jgi:hypothetical protein
MLLNVLNPKSALTISELAAVTSASAAFTNADAVSN